MPRHTPGPWRTHHSGATRVIADVPGSPGDIHTICNTWSSPLSPPRVEGEANARLIAAAPDLLAVAELARETAITVLGEVGADNVRQWASDLLQRAEAALTKAKGA